MEHLNQYIEHTLLKVDTSVADVRRVCEEAMANQFGAVCIPPLFVREARRIVGEFSKIKIATVIAFPMGYAALAAKTEEIKRAVDEGADEIDGVLNIAALRSNNWNHLENDIEGMALASNMRGKQLKLTLEMGILSPDELQKVAALALGSRVKFLSTSTDMAGLTVTPDMVRSLRKVTDPALKIKVVGNIKTKAQAIQLVEAGADRIGTLVALDIIKA